MPPKPEETEYLSQREIASRWRCAPSTVARIAIRAGLSRYALGSGRNGMVRYAADEIRRYEEARKT